jgi:hypothetical protein
MCDYLYYEEPRKKARKIAIPEPEPELEKVEEKPMMVKA